MFDEPKNACSTRTNVPGAADAQKRLKRSSKPLVAGSNPAGRARGIPARSRFIRLGRGNRSHHGGSSGNRQPRTAQAAPPALLMLCGQRLEGVSSRGVPVSKAVWSRPRAADRRRLRVRPRRGRSSARSHSRTRRCSFSSRLWARGCGLRIPVSLGCGGSRGSSRERSAAVPRTRGSDHDAERSHAGSPVWLSACS